MHRYVTGSFNLLLASFIIAVLLLAPPPMQSETQGNLNHGNSFLSSLSQDTIRPEIFAWGIDGPVSTTHSFVVWANVSDPGSGILNVSAVIRVDSNVSKTSRTLLAFNGSVFIHLFSPLEVNHTYTIWVEAYDNALNRAISYNRQFDLNVYGNTFVDPNVTLPFVLTGSMVTFIIAILGAREYNRRNPILEHAPIKSESETS